MATKGQIRPYRISFTFGPTEQCPDGIKAKHVFDDQDTAEREAQRIARRGGTAHVTREARGVVTDIATYLPWTAEQHRLVELAEQVNDLAYADDVTDENRREGLAVARELRKMALEQLNVKRF